MRCLAALLLLLLLLLVTAAPLGTSAGTLRRRDSLDLLDLGWRGKDAYYKRGDGVYCLKCPAGTFVAEECKEQNSSGRCEPCRYGEYMEYPNAFQWCQECLECREDQVQQSPCQPVRNTVCACKDGTFCPPHHPCEMCQRCQPRCPEGQEELKACTPDSDLQCGPARNSSTLYVVIALVITGVLVGILSYCLWKHCCSSPGDGRPSSRRPYEMVRSMFRKLPWNVEAEDNTYNKHLENQQPKTEPEALVPQPSGRPKRRLVPASQSDPSLALRSSFYTFAEKIPRGDWKKFGRKLDLEENDVVTATSDDGFFDMLLKWQNREGAKSSVNTLLETLDSLHLSGVADDISSALVQSERFRHGTS